MADIIEVQAVFEWESGLPEDRIVNTFHFRGPSDPLPAIGNVFDMLDDFYTAVGTGQTAALEAYMSEGFDGVYTLKAYDLDSPSPRPPFATRAGLITPGTTRMPNEVALCLSYKAADLAGANPARRRGRIYFGPLGLAINSTTGRPSDGLQGDLADAGNNLRAAAAAAVSWEWVTYSTVVPGAPTDATVAQVWVDNAWDTQRRRGVDATSRITLP